MKLQLQSFQQQLHQKDEQITQQSEHIQNKDKLWADFLSQQKAAAQQGASSQTLESIQQLETRLAQELPSQPAPRNDGRPGPYTQLNP